MSARGRELELAVKRAAVQYRREGRALLVQQYPRMANVNGFVREVGEAPADFIGALGDCGAAVECKECEAKSFPLQNIDEGQRTALDAFEEYGFDVRLVIEMHAYGEIYVVPWFQVAAFLIAPWRKSLSITWLRAFGQVAPVDGEAHKTRKVMFLEAVAHPESERCLLDVWDERATKPIVSLDAPDVPEVEPKPSPFRGLTPDEIRKRLNEAMQAGLERQMKRPKRQWGRKRRSA